MIQDLGVKRDFFEVQAKSVSYETTPDWLWPRNLILVPMCQLAEHQSNAVFNHTPAPLATASQLCSVFVTYFIYFFIYALFWKRVCHKCLTAWLSVVRGSSDPSAHLMVVRGWSFAKTRIKTSVFCLGFNRSGTMS